MSSLSSPAATLVAALALLAPPLAAQPATAPSPAGAPQAAAAPAEITLRTVMQHPEWLGREPQDPYWSADGASVYFERARATSEGLDPRTTELYRIDVAPPPAEPLGDEELEPIPDRALAEADAAERVRDRRSGRLLAVRDGDLFLHPPGGRARQLTRTGDRESAPFFLDDGRVGFVRGGAVYALDLETALLSELFQVLAGEAPLDELDRERTEAGYLGRQQDRLFDWVRAEQTRSRLAIERRETLLREDPSRPLPPLHVGKGLRPERVVASPDGRHALVVAGPEKPAEPRRDKMPAYVSASGFVEVEDVRPKVGDSGRGPHTLLLLDRLAGRVARIDLGSLPTIDEDPLAELRAAAERREQQRREAAGDSGSSSEEEGETGAAGQGAEDTEASEASEGADSGDGVPAAPAPGRPRPVSVVTAQWSADGGHVAVQLVSHDNKDRWVAVLAPDPGADAAPALRSLLHDHDPAWINWSFRDVVWHPGGDSLLALSERSGFSQLYRLPLAEGASPVALTTGDFVVDELQLSSDGQWAYFTANVLDPGAYDVFRVATSRPDAADAEELSASGRVSDKGGLTSFVLSPDDRRVLLLHSTSLRPPELFVQSAEAGAGAATQLTSLVSDEYLTLPWVEPRIVDVPATHPTAGNPDLRPIRARLFLPDADRFPAGDRPAAFFVHGAGYLQNAHRGWSSYFRETMFSSLLAQRGYVVLDMDYRGSAGYGRDWRTAIYRQMGTPEVEDLEDGVRYVAAEHGVDPQRVGVWGGSYGGFLTFMAMFRQPELFAAGAALRPVTDWAHYNHPYTSNILNTPELDPEAYERSSPIEFAQGLEKPLLICTGMLDDNVFFQDSVRLVQRLIELEKTGWEIAIYPVEPHGFLEPSSWLDEYRRILELFEEHVRGVCDCAEGP